MSFFDDLTRITRAHCAAQGLPTKAYDRPLSPSERYGRLSLEEIDRLPRIVRNQRYGLFDTVSAQIRQLIRNREHRAQRERDAWYIDPTPFRRLAHIEKVAKERAIQEKAKLTGEQS